MNMLKLLKKLGYQINDETGKRFYRTNCTDIVFLLAYFGLSIINLCASDPSFLLGCLNVVIISRIVIRNFMEIKTLQDYFDINKRNDVNDKNLNYSTFYITFLPPIKMAIEVTFGSIAFIIIILGEFFDFNNGVYGSFYWVISLIIGIIVLIFSACEDMLKILESLYDATLTPVEIKRVKVN